MPRAGGGCADDQRHRLTRLKQLARATLPAWSWLALHSGDQHGARWLKLCCTRQKTSKVVLGSLASSQILCEAA